MEPRAYYRLYPELRSRSWQRQSAHTRLMDHLIRKANPAQSQICGIDFPPGTILISSRQYCEQTGEHPQLFAYALRDLQYEGDIAVTLIGHNLIVTLTHYPTLEEAPLSQPASFSEPIPEATPEEGPSSQPASFSEPIPEAPPRRSPFVPAGELQRANLLIVCRLRSKNQHSKFNIPHSKRIPSPLPQQKSPFKIQHSTFKKNPLPASAARTTFKIQHSKFKTPPEPGRPPP